MFFSANVDRFSKLFYQLIRRIYVYTTKIHHTCNMLLHYLMKVENAKLLLILTASSTNC